MSETDQLNLIPPGGLFTSIAPALKNGQIMIMVTAEKEALRVNVTQKVEDGETPLSIAVVATPAELDTELPAAIVKAGEHAPALKSVTEQVAEQMAAAKADAPAGKAAPATKPKKAARPAKPAKPARVKPAKKKIAPPAAKKPAAKKAAAAPRQRFTNEQMLGEYVRLSKALGVTLTMDIYVKTAMVNGEKVGRSFERAFGGWKKFAAAGETHKPAGAVNDAPPPPPAKTSRKVYDVEGQLLGTTDAEPTPNELLRLADRVVGQVLSVKDDHIIVDINVTEV